MDEDKREDYEEKETENENIREEETKDEIRDEDYVNDDEIEMLRKIEERFSSLEEKLDNAISMMVDSGAIIQDSIDPVIEEGAEDYDDDFINIDKMDLAL